jgi:hypothetical protein
MQVNISTQPITQGSTIETKTAIANDREYKITQAELAHFEQQLAAVDRQDPTLHPRLILGRINSFQSKISINAGSRKCGRDKHHSLLLAKIIILNLQCRKRNFRSNFSTKHIGQR